MFSTSALQFLENAGQVLPDEEVSSLLIRTALGAAAALLLLSFLAILFPKSSIQFKAGIFTLVLTIVVGSTFVLAASATYLQPSSDTPEATIQNIEIIDPNQDKLVPTNSKNVNEVPL